MGLFRPYERKDSATQEQADERPRRRRSMVLGTDEPDRATTKAQQAAPAATPTTTPDAGSDQASTDGGQATVTQPRHRGPREKAGPTPSRREAEAARRERVNPNLSKKESRKLASRTAREQRLKAMEAREGQPEKVLLRNYIDSRFSLGEFLLPALLIVLALSFLNPLLPNAVFFTTGLMYLFILLVIIDAVMMWRGFKRLLAERVPRGSKQGLIYYGVMRMIQFRRLRMPRPSVKRGDKI